MITLTTENGNVIDLENLKENQKKDVVNGSGVNIDFYAPAPLPETPVFLLIARLIKEKGIFEFIEAANRLSIKYPEVKFNIVGDFDDQPTSLRQKDFDRIVKTIKKALELISPGIL